MIERLQLRGLSERTQEACVRAVPQLAEHYHKAPDLITGEEVREYFLHIINVRHYSRNTTTIALGGIRFFFEQTLNRNWTLFNIVGPAPAWFNTELCGGFFAWRLIRTTRHTNSLYVRRCG
ncbi:MAG: phage integrase N-terminal SAM-like domain-containing protein [Blastocatellales bacterium]|nr:phage integrase N-terminal SAM-like domain-containing protein [Blastocatellales bacterium]